MVKKQIGSGYTFNQSDVMGGQMARVGYSECDTPAYYNKFQVYDFPEPAQGVQTLQAGGRRKKRSTKGCKKSKGSKKGSIKMCRLSQSKKSMKKSKKLMKGGVDPTVDDLSKLIFRKKPIIIKGIDPLLKQNNNNEKGVVHQLIDIINDEWTKFVEHNRSEHFWTPHFILNPHTIKLLNQYNERGQTLLYVAARAGHIEFIDFVLYLNNIGVDLISLIRQKTKTNDNILHGISWSENLSDEQKYKLINKIFNILDVLASPQIIEDLFKPNQNGEIWVANLFFKNKDLKDIYQEFSKSILIRRPELIFFEKIHKNIKPEDMKKLF